MEQQLIKLHQFTRDSRNYSLARLTMYENLQFCKKDEFNIPMFRQQHNKLAKRLNVPLFDVLLGLSSEEQKKRLKLHYLQEV